MSPEQITRERTDRVTRGESLTPRQVMLRKFTRFLWWGTAVLEGFIGLRVLLRMMAADPNNAFANFIYSFTNVFLSPFSGLTATPQSGGIVLEISSVIAMLVYLLLAWVFIELLRLILGRESA
jgi:uncharacterized protein YggT (Ycf19 family)